MLTYSYVQNRDGEDRNDKPTTQLNDVRILTPAENLLIYSMGIFILYRFYVCVLQNRHQYFDIT